VLHDRELWTEVRRCELTGEIGRRQVARVRFELPDSCEDRRPGRTASDRRTRSGRSSRRICRGAGEILDSDWRAPKYQRPTTKWIFDRLREEQGGDGSYERQGVVSVKLRTFRLGWSLLGSWGAARESPHSSRAAACVSSLSEFRLILPFVARRRSRRSRRVPRQAAPCRDTCACPTSCRPRVAAEPPRASARCAHRGRRPDDFRCTSAGADCSASVGSGILPERG
jgi:hypothetical protein